MLYREIIADCSEIHTKHTNALCGKNMEILGVKPGGTYTYHYKGLNTLRCLRTSFRLSHKQNLLLPLMTQKS
jgi:hypothetical protein